jgi:hypothetical protein
MTRASLFFPHRPQLAQAEFSPWLITTVAEPWLADRTIPSSSTLMRRYKWKWKKRKAKRVFIPRFWFSVCPDTLRGRAHDRAVMADSPPANQGNADSDCSPFR